MATTSATYYNDLSDFLSKHNSNNTQNNQEKIITHTRIGSKELSVYGGCFNIKKEELPIFYKLYYEHIFVKSRKEYLTEKQLEQTGPILIDLDFRYDFSVMSRQHTQEHIQDIIQVYLDEIAKLLTIEQDVKFPIFIMEKPNVNRVVEKQETKDGIHIIIGVQMDRVMQTILREKVLNKIGDVCDLPLTNDWSSILDEGISKGCVNWQMYGSQKPGHEAYRLTYYLIAELDFTDGNWMTEPRDVRSIDLSKDFHLLSAQYEGHAKFDVHPKIKDEYEKRVNNKSSVSKSKKSGKSKINLIFEEEDDNIDLSDIQNMAMLDKAVSHIIDNLKTNEHHIKEIHDYTQVLPKKYYQPGSHVINTQVAFALKHTDERLFLSWVKLRSKAEDFDFNSIPYLYQRWKGFSKKGDGITRRSIMYWAKQDAFEDYEKVKLSTIDHYIEDTIFEAGDFDYAMVLYHMFKDKYVCSSITNKRWYVFRNHRWIRDEGQSLRLAISKDMFQLYSDKQGQFLIDAQNITQEPTDAVQEKSQRRIKKLAEICIKLKKTNDKNNIMREAMEIFYDNDFVKNMDANPFLLCFTNGVFDFKSKEFRQGYPQDYVTKTTGIPYIIKPENPIEYNEMEHHIKEFMKQLFPQPSLCRYMWDHLASTLIGIKKEHAFNIYRGSGSNGKSILTDLMSQALGDYKGTVPITLVTEKRNSIGGTSSEVIQLKGVRYAVMQEPSKDAVINEGILKELTGGDPIQARALYSDSEIFIPQFSLAVCTNSLFEIKSNDDGTWRRMKLVDFISKFISEGETHTDDTQYVFPKDKSLKEKLPKWAPIFMQLLVKRACETDGEVVDCDEVLGASNKYRQSQDCIAGFISDKIEKDPNGTIGKKVLNDEFKEWFLSNNPGRKIPKLMELEEIITKKFGSKNIKTGKWSGIKIKSEVNEDVMDDLDN